MKGALDVKKCMAYVLPSEVQGHAEKDCLKVALQSFKTVASLRYHVVRGSLDTSGVEARRRGRSKYGAKRPKS